MQKGQLWGKSVGADTLSGQHNLSNNNQTQPLPLLPARQIALFRLCAGKAYRQSPESRVIRQSRSARFEAEQGLSLISGVSDCGSEAGKSGAGPVRARQYGISGITLLYRHLAYPDTGRPQTYLYSAAANASTPPAPGSPG